MVCVVTGAPLCRNPRVVKEANALAAAGCVVTVLGPILSQKTKEEDDAIVTGQPWCHRATVDLRRTRLRAIRARVVRRAANEAVRRFSVQSPASLGYNVRSALHAARRVNADLYIGHQEVGLWVASRLAAEGRRVGADLEDWYSADLSPEARAERPIRLLRQLERAALRYMRHVTTTSATLADALSREYHAPAPTVVYNAFPLADAERVDGLRKDRRNSARPSLHWVSQTVGRGRGLEALCHALVDVAVPVEVHLRGQCSVGEERRLRQLFPADRGHELYVHPLVPNGELLSRIAEHDVGLALEPYDPPNKQYTVSNKITHYLLAGLAIVATDTAGQQEVASYAPGAVRLCRPDNAASLAAAINAYVTSTATLLRARHAAQRAAVERFCWEQQVPVLLRSVERALD